MQNHLLLHEQEHQEREKLAEKARLAAKIQTENPGGNEALAKLGRLMVTVGEKLEERGSQPSLERRRA